MRSVNTDWEGFLAPECSAWRAGKRFDREIRKEERVDGRRPPASRTTTVAGFRYGWRRDIHTNDASDSVHNYPNLMIPYGKRRIKEDYSWLTVRIIL